MTWESAFLLTDLDVIRLRASQSETTEPHFDWHVNYAPEPLEDHPNMRVVIGHLHVGGTDGYGDISVGCLFLENSIGVADEALPQAVAEAEATESLYDVARSHLVGLLATVGADIKVPRKSPDPEVAVLHRHDNHEDDGAPKELDR
jgi:hypothetical protein